MLTEEEIDVLYGAYKEITNNHYEENLGYLRGLSDGAKAQLKKVVEWGDEKCPHSNEPEWENWLRRECTECWQVLLEEVK